MSRTAIVSARSARAEIQEEPDVVVAADAGGHEQRRSQQQHIQPDAAPRGGGLLSGARVRRLSEVRRTQRGSSRSGLLARFGIDSLGHPARRATDPGRQADRAGESPASGDRSSTDVLQLLAGLEADGPAGRDAHFFAGAWVTADAALARLHLEDAEAPQLDPIAALHRDAHRVEHRVHRQLSFDLGDVGGLGRLR